MAGLPFNISNMFRNTQQTVSANPPAPAPAPAQPQGTPGSSMQQGGMKQEEQEGGSPLDGFAKLWETDPTSGANPPSDPFSEPLFATDPNKIREAASQMDFISQLPQELMQKAMSGQDPQAFMQVINTVAQNSLATALQVATGTVEQAGSKIGKRFNDALPARFKDLQINSAAPANPVLNHPSVQPMLKMARQQIKMMNPDYTPEQVNKEAERYLSSFASALTDGDPNKPVAPKSADDETDWMSWVQSQGQSR